MVTLTGSATLANYQTALNAITFNNTSDTPNTTSRSITVVVNDGSNNSNTAITTINVIASNDAPVLDLDGSAAGANYIASFVEAGTGVSGSGAVSIADTDRTITDVDSGNIVSATITLTNAQTGDVLAAGTLPAGITASVVGNVVTLTGSATLANYQAALNAITFNNTSDTPNTTPRSITVVVNDGSNNSNIATTTINVTASNDAPTVGNSSVSVSEEGLLGGLADTSGNPSDTTNLATGSGTISIVDPDSVETVSLVAPATALSSGGVSVVWTLSNAGHTLVGTAGAAGPEVLRATITDGGAYTVTLSKAIDHVSGNGENISTLSIGVRATDGVATTQGTLTVNIEDDAPTAIAGTQTVVLPSQDTNIMLILDVSGSMSDDADGVAGGPTRLEVMKTSINMMLSQYDNLGDIKVRIVTFSDNGAERDPVWVDLDRAQTIINGLTAGGSTNYDAALLTAQGAFTDSGKIVGGKNVSYFLTDGQPTSNADWDGGGPLTRADGIQAGEEALWINFLNANQINSMAYGMGVGATQANMNPVAYNGMTQTNTNAIVVANPAVDLPPILRDSIVAPAGGDLVSGSLGAGSGVGADGGNLATFVLNGSTYSNGGAVTGTNRGTYDAATNAWTVTTIAGGKFVVDMDTSLYTYTPPASTAANYSESVGYTLRDNDGDTASSTLTINVLPPQLVTLSSTTGSSVTAGKGLHGEFFGYNETVTTGNNAQSGDTTVGNLDSIADITAIINLRQGSNIIGTANSASAAASDASFVADGINYGQSPTVTGNLGTNTNVAAGSAITTGALYNFLGAATAGSDASSLQATSTFGQTTDSIMRMVGKAYFTGGQYDFQVRADDGFSISIDGVAVLEYNANQPPTTRATTTPVTIGEGFHTVEIVYWEQGGNAELVVQYRPTGSGTYLNMSLENLAMYQTGSEPVLTDRQDMVETSNGVWAIRTGADYTGTVNSEKVVGTDGRDHISAGGGNDIVQAGAGSDYISGGQGSDLLTGGLGSDTFAWALGDQGSVGSPAKDTIADFNVASKALGGDILDLRDLLQGENHTTGTGNLADYLHFTKDASGGTVIDVKNTGAGGGVNQQIVLSGVDLTSNSTLTDTQIIQNLLNNGKLLTD